MQTAQSEQISPHQIRIIDFMSKESRWVTANEIADGAGVAKRTASQHAHRLAQLGVFDQAVAFPGHRYKLSESAPRGYFKRIEAARAALNMVQKIKNRA